VLGVEDEEGSVGYFWSIVGMSLIFGMLEWVFVVKVCVKKRKVEIEVLKLVMGDSNNSSLNGDSSDRISLFAPTGDRLKMVYSPLGSQDEEEEEEEFGRREGEEDEMFGLTSHQYPMIDSSSSSSSSSSSDNDSDEDGGDSKGKEEEEEDEFGGVRKPTIPKYKATVYDLLKLMKEDKHLIAGAVIGLLLAAIGQVLVPHFAGEVIDSVVDNATDDDDGFIIDELT